jgi:23S rRNA pseudouridine2605 synthase
MSDEPERELEHEAEGPEQDIASAAPEIARAEAASADETDAEEQGAGPAPKLERLQKILAQAGIASRRHAEELITGGHVQVNGQTVTVLGTKADADRDHIRVDGKLLRGAERLRYFMLNKPKGHVTTVSDPEGRPTVMEFFSKTGERLYPVGRLDYLSEGLLLVTNDGELANGLTKASAGVEKTYLVKVAGQPEEAALDRLREGVTIERGKVGEGKVRTAPARIRQVRVGENPWFEVVLIEGRNRELRKMFEEIGHHVEKIRRVGYGPLVLDLEPGKVRELDTDEVEALRLTAAGKFKPKRLKTKKLLPRDAGKPVSYDDDRPRSQRVAAKSTAPRPPRAEFGKREGGFAKPAGSFAKPAGRFVKPAGSFAKREGGFSKPAGDFAKRPGSFAKPAGGFAKREGGFTKPAGGFAKREGGFTKPAGSFEKRPGGFVKKDRPFRPAAGSRAERPAAGEQRSFTPRSEGAAPHRGGSARFGRPEGGRTSNRSDDRGFRPDTDRKPFRPRADRPAYGDRTASQRPAAPRRDFPAPAESVTPRKPSTLRIESVDSERPATSRPPGAGAPRGGKPAFDRPKFDRPRFDRAGSDRVGSDRPKFDRPASDRPRFDRPKFDKPRPDKPRFDKPRFDKPRFDKPSFDKPKFERAASDRPRFDRARPDREGRTGSARPPRGEGSTRPFTTSTGKPRPGGARPSNKHAKTAGKPFAKGPGTRPAGKSTWKPKPGGAGKPASGGARPKAGGYSKPGGFKGKPGGAGRSGPRPSSGSASRSGPRPGGKKPGGKRG